MEPLRRGDETLPRSLDGRFSLAHVCWGYRDLFAGVLRSLEQAGLIGEDREEVTQGLVAFLNLARDNDCFAHVLREFLLGLNDHTRWTMKLPGIFSDILDMGRRLAEHRIGYGVTYFTLFGEGEFGDKPVRLRRLMRWLRRLEPKDPELALALLKNHRTLSARLTPAEVDRYLDEGLRLHESNSRNGVRFMAGATKASESCIRTLSQECRLADMRSELSMLIRAMSGREVELDDLGKLDSDELIERNTRFVCLYQWMSVPSRIRAFPTERRNRTWYLLQAVMAAGMLALDSFPVVHGHPSAPSAPALTGDSLARLNLFEIVEYTRVLEGIDRMWPGARRLMRFGIETEKRLLPPHSDPDRLLFACLDPDDDSEPPVQLLRDLAAQSVNVFATVELLTDDTVGRCVRALPQLATHSLRTFMFLPDFRYPAEVSSPPSDALVADLKQQARDRTPAADGEDRGKTAAAQRESPGRNRTRKEQGDEPQPGAPQACFLYDEWCEQQGDYFPDYCQVHEMVPEPAPAHALPAGVAREAERVRRVFELLKPDTARREKYLEEGDSICTDLLVSYLVDRRREASPRITFYEKPRIVQRDLALLVLLDISGSTGESGRHERFIDIQKNAALILGEGLAGLGDRFAICGFSGSGRENCEYFVYKDFDEPWDITRRGRIMAAVPRSSTRIGPALRHSGYRLTCIEARKRLVILVSDGRPMDNGYDPNTRYAQYDVRMACKENRRKDIHTFCISTNENTLADMQIMFPDGGFAILPRSGGLPAVLPRMYLRLTS